MTLSDTIGQAEDVFEETSPTQSLSTWTGHLFCSRGHSFNNINTMNEACSPSTSDWPDIMEIHRRRPGSEEQSDASNGTKLLMALPVGI